MPFSFPIFFSFQIHIRDTKHKCLEWVSILLFLLILLMVLQVTTTPEADGSAANVCLLEQCLHCCEEAKGKQNKLKQFFQKIFFLNNTVGSERKSQHMLHPKWPRSQSR